MHQEPHFPFSRQILNGKFLSSPLIEKKRGLFADLFLFILAIGLTFGFISYFHQVAHSFEMKVDIDLSFSKLPQYTFFSLARGLFAYIISLMVSILFGVWAGRDRWGEKGIVPLFDIGGSIPILGFMPGVILLMITLFPKTNLGLEIAAIILMFQNQVWNMGLGVYHSLRTVPQDKLECGKAFRFSSWQSLRWIELPFTTISLVWNSIIGVAGGWFLLMVNEAFQLGDKDFRLPGLGSYMSVAAEQGNIPAMVAAIVSMILLILFLNKFLWDPLVVWSKKFRIEEVSSNEHSSSFFLNILEESLLLGSLRKRLKTLFHYFQYKLTLSKERKPRKWGLFISRLMLLCLVGLIVLGLSKLSSFLQPISLSEWMLLLKMTSKTLLRVGLCLVLSFIIAFPLGIAIGLSEKYRKYFQSIIQVAASFPATLLFPLLIFLWNPTLRIQLELVAIFLMLLGSMWYVLFNVIAGARALPSDLKEVALDFKIRGLHRFKSLYFPGVFPYLVTGMLSASGGAWNASIVAEFISYRGKVSTIPGIGSFISNSAEQGNIPLLVASVMVMSLVVVTLNLAFWLRLYHYSEKHFALNF